MRLPSANFLSLNPSTTTPKARIEEAAHGLETQFAAMLIKSMRGTTSGDPLAGSNTTYREMYDQQLAKELSKGRGLGLAPTIIRQLERQTQPAAAPAAPVDAFPLNRTGGAMPLAQPLSAFRLSGGLSLAPTSSGVSMQAFSAPAAPVAPAPVADAPVNSAACDANAPLDCSSPEAFVKSIWPHAKKVAEQLQVPAKALVAQAALETGWGRRLIGKAQNVVSHNLFGIKAGGKWAGAKVTTGTHEYTNGVRHGERASFRAYGSAGESFNDYARLLSGNRYANARGTGDDTQRFASALQHAGYATDPSYANKISAIANGATLNRALAALDTTRG